VADALWELSDRFDVGVWYKCKNAGVPNVYDVFCGVVVNGVRLGQPHCRAVEECVERIVEDYKRGVEKMKEPPAPSPPNMAEELLREWPELGALGVEWVKKWAILKERLVEVAKTLRRYPWMAEVARRNSMSIHMIEVYVAKDGSEVCLSLNQPKFFCTQNGAVREVQLELEFKQYEACGDERGVQAEGTAGVCRGGKGICENALNTSPAI